MAGEKLKKLLYRIRSLDDCLARARFNLVEIYPESRSVRVTMICDNTVSDELRAMMLDVLNRELPASFKKIALDVKKIRSDEELVRREIFNYLKENCKSVAHSVTREDIIVNMPKTAEKGDLSDERATAPTVISFSVACDKDMAGQFESHATLREIEGYLARTFCDDFRGELITRDVEIDFSVLKEKPVQIDYVNYRSIKVDEVVKLDDLIGTDRAIYIDDVSGVMDSVYLCGEILSVRERVTSAGKPYYLIEFSDKTGKIVGTYFNKKATEAKVRALAEGDGIIIQGNLDMFRDRLSLTIKKINYCRFPKDFVPERKPSKLAPIEYSYIFPERLAEYTQREMFAAEAPPPAPMLGKTFVVFDVETTGTEPLTDTVTEIGAVKIVDGRITEKFGSLINPGVKISEKITSLTGIDNAMVADKPRFSQVTGDIYKFFEGAILVAHNIDFDYKFLRRLSGESGYYYYNVGMDTLQFAREVMPTLPNHKLKTVAEKFGIEFNAHRATDDAYATAKMFIKLVEKSGRLPDERL
ncbi:MAG: ribonuclease H-like domain-containing protein [Clostridia bacterium]|nr:ribonuclease H-like domain-containing protein [Clostridia bacterium]